MTPRPNPIHTLRPLLINKDCSFARRAVTLQPESTKPEQTMQIRGVLIPLMAGFTALAAMPAEAKKGASEAVRITSEAARTMSQEAAGTGAADTTITVDRVQVTAIKQGPVLRSTAVASSILGSREVERGGISALKQIAAAVPNLHAPDYGSRMTSSIYVRGLGARIDQPVIGVNVDNVPLMNKNAFDTELADIERIEVLRGPQSTLYGRNTMGGVVNIHTLSPLTYEGVRLLAEYGSGNTLRLKASTYYRPRPDVGFSVTGFYTRSDGFFENEYTHRTCDREWQAGGRWKMQWDNGRGLRLDNTLSLARLEQGGYPYAYAGQAIVEEGETVLRPGQIAYNDPSGYRRTTISDGLTLRLDRERYSLSSITAWQYLDDAMTLDQDFTPLSYFTLRQAVREHALSEDLILRSRGEERYGWLVGAFAFYRHQRMEAPVTFKRTGIERLILDNANRMPDLLRYGIEADELPLLSAFRNPTWGAALYHESRLRLGRWLLTAGVRVDLERTQLQYHSQADLDYTLSISGGKPSAHHIAIDDTDRLSNTYFEVLPKVTVLYAFDPMRNLYLSIARGSKSGGFNTQLFSDLLQERLQNAMLSGAGEQSSERMSYRPEYSWNFEFGGHFSCLDGAVRGDFALFWIEVSDQQLTVFPEGQATGRMMANAGHSRSRGAELSLQASPTHDLTLNVAWGYTDARFVRYRSGTEDYAGRRIPYAPQHTLSARATWSRPTGIEWLGEVVVQAGVEGAGPIAWNEQNSLTEPFYALFDASIRFEHRRWSIGVWGRNLTESVYNVFYFKSIGHEFVQCGRPRTFGLTLTLNID